jgi:pimeloyl-ACP methyl ester carboxylesterase
MMRLRALKSSCLKPLALTSSFALVVACVAASLALASPAFADDCTAPVVRVEHQIPISDGGSLHVTETFSPSALEQWGPPRAIVMLPGPATNGALYNIPVDGFDGGAIMARHGYFAYAVDYEGTGQSTYPAQGTAVTLASQVDAVASVIQFVQATRGVHRVDMLGESWGGGIAAELCADKHACRTCIMASMIYKVASPASAAQFQSPQWLAFLEAQPNGYLATSAALYAPLVTNSPPAVQSWFLANEPGSYTIEPFVEFINLPFFDPTVARVPGLIIQGELDPQSVPSDIAALASDYGKHGAGLVTISGGGHIPRIEPAPHNTEYWDAVKSFVDANGNDGNDEWND